MQVLGGVFVCLGAITALLARIIGFELDIFYVVISIVGAGLFLYGALQKNQHELAKQQASMRQRVSINGD